MDQKFRVREVNIQDNTVLVAIRGDLIGTVAKCCRNCKEERAQVSATRALGNALSDAGDMLFESLPVEGNEDAADRIITKEGAVREAA